MSAVATRPALAAHHISKFFGHVTALDDVSFDVAPGEVVALMGDNGAGKSTLVKCLSGGQRQGVAVARAAAFGSRVVIMDEPTAALGVKESRRVLELMLDVKRRGLPIVLISHNMPHVFEVADRIHIHRLGRRLAVIDPKQYTMSDAVAFMTGAKTPPEALAAA
jgi:fructose transport system ATP-binding protein